MNADQAISRCGRSLDDRIPLMLPEGLARKYPEYQSGCARGSFRRTTPTVTSHHAEGRWRWPSGSAAGDAFAGLALQSDQGRLAITWARPDQDDMTLSAPMAPMAHRDHLRAVRAALGDRNPWKEATR